MKKFFITLSHVFKAVSKISDFWAMLIISTLSLVMMIGDDMSFDYSLCVLVIYCISITKLIFILFNTLLKLKIEMIRQFVKDDEKIE